MKNHRLQHCINVMRDKVLYLNESNFNKQITSVSVNAFNPALRLY
jgi:hypothetical protein